MFPGDLRDDGCFLNDIWEEGVLLLEEAHLNVDDEGIPHRIILRDSDGRDADDELVCFLDGRHI